MFSHAEIQKTLQWHFGCRGRSVHDTSVSALQLILAACPEVQRRRKEAQAVQRLRPFVAIETSRIEMPESEHDFCE